MPFTKENAAKLQAKGVESKKKQRDQFEEYITSGGLRRSVAIIQEMLEDGTIDPETGEIKKAKITKIQKEGIDILLKFFPYYKGKRGNVDEKGDTIPTNINILQTTTEELLKITKGNDK